jgi:hypothetical protein
MTFLEEIKRPFNFITTLIAIISLALSVYFYYESKKEKHLAYKIDRPSSKIFDSENSSPAIKLIEKDSVLITKNVYLLTGAIWNNGNLPINKEDLRKKLSIKINYIERILDYKVVQQTEPTISLFKLTQKNKSTLDIDWAYFDPGYGFKFQLLYIGSENVGFELDGKVLDIKHFNEIIDTRKGLFWIYIFFSIFCVLMSTVLGIMLYKRRKIKWTGFEYSILLYVILILISGTYFILTRLIMKDSPPF